ncbi:hypothetical protein EDD86DRAFT_246070 [Gorgonomyces haynaldii]|nr:hypothetical protein EDD86DRAFT_246070 [Gorgonomyces haynaldii]
MTTLYKIAKKASAQVFGIESFGAISHKRIINQQWIQLPVTQETFVKPGTLIGYTGTIENKRVLIAPTTEALKGSVLGSNLFLEHIHGQDASIIVGGRDECGIIELDGSQDLYCSPQHFLLKQDLKLEIIEQEGSLRDGFCQYRLYGQGLLGVQAKKLTNLTLNVVVVRESSVQFEPIVSDLVHLKFKELKPRFTEKWEPRVKQVFETALNACWYGYQWLQSKFRYHVLGKRGFYKLKGPGSIYIKNK